ncbi:MAG TPA: GAF domain-containing protein [Terriglobales bacterium]|jgi:L-methionine (R)-S-oxide reductase|nr:GAF domain-containing protein [Terriglobales bacterium]
MSTYEEMLQEFEVHALSAVGLKPLMEYIAERLHARTTRYNWVGFYFMEEPACDALVLGPHAGSFEPTLRIPLNKGLCGAAARSGQTVAVNNVANDSRYLGSDMVKSNMVVPIFVKGRVMAEICIESYFLDTFTSSEQRFIESCAKMLGRYMETGSAAAKGAGGAH